MITGGDAALPLEVPFSRLVLIITWTELYQIRKRRAPILQRFEHCLH